MGAGKLEDDCFAPAAIYGTADDHSQAGEKQLGQVMGPPEALRHLKFTEATWFRSRKQSSGMTAMMISV